MQNRTFLVLLRPIFCEKLKTAPPKEIGCRSCEVDVVILAEKSVSISVKTFFFFFFWRPPVFGQRKRRLNFWFWPKSLTQFRWRFFFFFGDHLFLGAKNEWISELSKKFRLNFRTNRVKLIHEQWKFGSRSFALFSLFQKSPPLFQILATRLIASIRRIEQLKIFDWLSMLKI